MSAYTGPERVVPLSERRTIVAGVLAPLAPSWDAGGEWGYVECPGKDCHSNANGARDCRVYVTERPGRAGAIMPPGCYCLHTSCAGVLAEVNRRLRSAIGKAKVAGVGRGASTGAGSRAGGGEGTGTGGAAGTAKDGSRTHRTDVFAPPPGGGTPVRTERTVVLGPLDVYVRAQAQAKEVGNGAHAPSGASEVAQPGAQQGPQPVKIEATGSAQPLVAGPLQSLMADQTGCAPKSTPPGVDVLVWINGQRMEKGRWVGENWVRERYL